MDEIKDLICVVHASICEQEDLALHALFGERHLKDVFQGLVDLSATEAALTLMESTDISESHFECVVVILERLFAQ